jgi:CMP-N-acetylneuraminate monooxygenase
MTLGELVQNYPEAAMLLANKGLHCIGCGMAASETIEQGAKAHGMSDSGIKTMLDEMNRIVLGKKDKKNEQ